MTSFIIDAHKDRPIPPSWEQDPECPFCRIVQGDAPAFRVYEDDMVVAVLGWLSLTTSVVSNCIAHSTLTDILPLRQGHTLVIPKVHTSRVSELSPEFAAATGKAVSKVANALTKGTVMIYLYHET